MDQTKCCYTCGQSLLRRASSFPATRRRERSSQDTPKRHSWPVYPPRKDPESLDVVHTRRRSSLCGVLSKLALTMSQQCNEINDRLDRISTPATNDGKEGLSSLSKMCATLRLELDNLKAQAEVSVIPRQSSFWVQSWKVVYNIRRRISDLELLLLQLDFDHKLRLVEGDDGEYVEGRLDSGELRAFVREVEQGVGLFARTCKGIRAVNIYAFEAWKEPLTWKDDKVYA